MEGVGARLGRSSTRYGPATVFSGPVRKWKKRWVPLSHPSSSASSAASANGARSHLLLYKWAPVSSPANGAPHPEEPPPRKFRFVPVTGPPSSSWLLISIPTVKLGSFTGTVVLDLWVFLGFIILAFLRVCVTVSSYRFVSQDRWSYSWGSESTIKKSLSLSLLFFSPFSNPKKDQDSLIVRYDWAPCVRHPMRLAQNLKFQMLYLLLRPFGVSYRTDI